MLNEQLTCLTPFSQIDWPGLAWQTREHKEINIIVEIFFVIFVHFVVKDYYYPTAFPFASMWSSISSTTSSICELLESTTMASAAGLRGASSRLLSFRSRSTIC
jgi:hypothetical protein